MNRILTKSIDVTLPVMKFYEDGDWLRIVVPGRPDRFLSKKLATDMMRQIGVHSLAEKPDLILHPFQ